MVTVVGSDGFSEADVLRFAASVERGSEHPLAAAIVNAAEARSVPLAAAQGFRSITGKGVMGRVEGKAVALGNAALLQDLGVDGGTLAHRAEASRQDGQSVMFVCVEGTVIGLLGTADPIKESSKEAIDLLHKEGIKKVGKGRRINGLLIRCPFPFTRIMRRIV